MPATIAVLQARVSSTRLPGKVLLPVLGVPMLARQIERVRRARSLDGLVVATSVDMIDDGIEALCQSTDVLCFRGSREDVLDRFVRAMRAYQADRVVRLTGDCPLSDPGLIDRVVHFHVEGGFDYSSNIDPPTFPDGLDVEVVGAEVLEDAWREATMTSEREHVTLWIRRHARRFRIGYVVDDVDRSCLRWTVDEPADLDFVRTVYERLYPSNPSFTTADVLALVEADPAIAVMNAGFERNEGFTRSLVDDQPFQDPEV